ncbi:MAG: hypothetical protein K2W97_08060 [Chthoniobacterales bacterium]|nr:hypothetical protein [Chthoniobacterales bacterium]
MSGNLSDLERFRFDYNTNTLRLIVRLLSINFDGALIESSLTETVFVFPIKEKCNEIFVLEWMELMKQGTT